MCQKMAGILMSSETLLSVLKRKKSHHDSVGVLEYHQEQNGQRSIEHEPRGAFSASSLLEVLTSVL